MRGKSCASFLLLLYLALEGMKAGTSALTEAECKVEKRVGINACTEVLYGENPSPQCCERVRVSHVECVCPLVTRKVAATVDVNRAIRLIEGCGRRVPHHFKCGAITTP